MKEGVGGEEGLERVADQSGAQEEQQVGEESRETAEVRSGRRGIFQGLNPGKLVKAFARNKLNEEMTRGAESEREEQMACDEDGSTGHSGAESGEGEQSKEKEARRTRKERVNLLKVLQIGRLKRGISKGDREMDSSVESLNEIAKEGKGCGELSESGKRVKGSSKIHSEDESKREVKEEDRNAEFKKSSSDKGQAAAREREDGAEAERTAKTESAAEKFPVTKLLKAHQLAAASSRARSKEKEENTGSGESDVERERNTEEESQEGSAAAPQSDWRGRKTRKARRVARGRKMRESREKLRGENAEGKMSTMMMQGEVEGNGKGNIKAKENKV